MKIRMIKTLPVAVDGIHTRLFREGTVYQTNDPGEENYIPLDSAELLVNRAKVAEIVRERVRVEPSEAPIVEPSEIKETIDEIGSDEQEGMRVHEFAKEFKVTNRTVMNTAKKLGISATAPMSGLTFDEVKKVKESLGIE